MVLTVVMLVVNHDVAVPVPEDGTFENYVKYLDGLNQRYRGIVRAICQIWKSTPQEDGKPRRIIVLRNSLSWLSSMHPHHSIHGSEAIAEATQTTEELQNEVSFIKKPLTMSLHWNCSILGPGEGGSWPCHPSD